MKTLVALGDSDAAASISQALTALGHTTPGLAADSDAAIGWINENGGCDLIDLGSLLRSAGRLLTA
jgi:hypothetical protein